MPDKFLDSLDEKEEGEKRYHKSNFRYDEARDTYVLYSNRIMSLNKRGRQPKLESTSPAGGNQGAGVLPSHQLKYQIIPSRGRSPGGNRA